MFSTPTTTFLYLQVFMLSCDQLLDEPTVSAIMAAKPYSRLPVCATRADRNVVARLIWSELLR